MGWFEALVLGLVQGLTEFLPISSSAHIRLTAAFAGWDDPGAAFTAVTQIGTELAVLLYFSRKIGRILRHWFLSLTKREYRSDPDARMGWLIIVGSLPIGVLGLLFEERIESVFRDLRLTATTLIVFGLLLLVADRVGSKRRELDQLTVPHGLGYGFAQALALILGVSRSGGTITGGLLLGYKRWHRGVRLPARGARRARLSVQADRHRGRRRTGCGTDPAGHHRVLRCGLRGDRVADVLHQEQQLPAVRGLPRRPGTCGAGAGVHRCARPDARARHRGETSANP